jgi:excisionase family DNA binding protein
MDSKEARPPMSVAEAALEFGVKEQVVWKAIRGGRLKALRIGRAWRIRPDVVERVKRGEDAA